MDHDETDATQNSGESDAAKDADNPETEDGSSVDQGLGSETGALGGGKQTEPNAPSGTPGLRDPRGPESVQQ
ncbi:MAG: hypothetical protein H0U42_07625 [Thermoleophilaceae bacterium]|nr:hypothetical protein [Thermoleophilaceae bacterium]